MKKAKIYLIMPFQLSIYCNVAFFLNKSAVESTIEANTSGTITARIDDNIPNMNKTNRR